MRFHEDPNEDDLKPARGIFYAFLFSVLLLALIGQFIFLLR